MDKTIVEKHLDRVLEKTNLKNLGERRQGKVRDIYTQDDKIILVATDRYSAFDRNLALIPFKGQVLTQTSRFWFEQTKDIIQNHIISSPDPNVVVVKKCKTIPLEMVVRGYMTGVTGTSLWTLYQKGLRDFGDFKLPDGMRKNQKLEHPVLTPTTKSEEHDRPLTSREIIEERIVPEQLWLELADTTLELFKRGQQIALQRGLILVDTKYEFGLDQNDKLILIDEIHTPTHPVIGKQIPTNSASTKDWNRKILIKNSSGYGLKKIPIPITIQFYLLPRPTWSRNSLPATSGFTNRLPAISSKPI